MWLKKPMRRTGQKKFRNDFDQEIKSYKKYPK